MWWQSDSRMRAIGNRLTDELLDAYVAWREHCVTLAECHRHWRAAPLEDRAHRSASYRSALDQEECAALAYQAACERLVRFVPHALAP
jgi:hypothetical protein